MPLSNIKNKEEKNNFLGVVFQTIKHSLCWIAFTPKAIDCYFVI
jgi:hypothetical protein